MGMVVVAAWYGTRYFDACFHEQSFNTTFDVSVTVEYSMWLRKAQVLHGIVGLLYSYTLLAAPCTVSAWYLEEMYTKIVDLKIIWFCIFTKREVNKYRVKLLYLQYLYFSGSYVVLFWYGYIKSIASIFMILVLTF